MKPGDYKLLDELRRYSRASLTEMSSNTGIPLSTVFKKVVRLENGLILRHVALIDFNKIGYSFKIGLFVSVKRRKDFEEYVKDFHNLNTLLKLSGDYDYYAEVFFRNMSEYQDFEDAMKSSNLVKKHKIHFMSDLRREGFEIDEAEEDEEEAICGMVKNENDILLCEDCPHHKDELCDYSEEDEEEFEDYFGDSSEEFCCGYCGEIYPTEEEGEECCKAEKEIH
jgi:DNA-binding Lrp family transcriptional regulator